MLIVSIGVKSQNYEWTPSINIATMVRTDTVLTQPVTTVLPENAGNKWSVTIYTTDLNANVIVTFGSSNNVIASKSLRGFEPFVNDSLPYTFSKAKCRVITNNDTTYQKTFTGGSTPFNFARMQLKLIKSTSTSGTIRFKFLFSK